MLSWSHACAAFEKQPIFRKAGMPFLVSPQPLALPRRIVKELEGLGHVLHQFQKASQKLYEQSVRGKSYDWLAPILDAGKAPFLVEAQHAVREPALPRVIRPDLLCCEEGLRLTEIDSVPGGLGVLHFLNSLYASAGFGDSIVGGAEGIVDGLRRAYPQGALMSVSEESSDYRPEMRYLVDSLGDGFAYTEAEALTGAEGKGQWLYRFFELFDADNIPAAQQLISAWSRGECRMDAPPLAHLEEKAWLALFHLPALQDYWEAQLRGSHLRRLRQLIPRSWLLDPAPLPPHASMPWLNINHWSQLAKLSQKQRRLVVKISGYDERAWGARGVYVGHDMNTEAWTACLEEAHSNYPENLWIMQEYSNTAILQQQHYNPATGQLELMRGRVRLCPYYIYEEGRDYYTLAGCLSTMVPEEKKKIHGMSTAIVSSCRASCKISSFEFWQQFG